MTDYFGALLRSAGRAPVAAGRGPIALPDGTAEHAVETVETPPVRAAVPNERVGKAQPHAASASPAEQDFADPHEARHETPNEAPHETPHETSREAPHGAARNAPASAASQQPAPADATHPAVRAALAWVGADPAVVERIAPGMPRTPLARPAAASAAQAQAAPVAALPAPASPGAERSDAQSVRDAVPRPQADAVSARRPAPAAAPEPGFEIDLDLPRAARTGRASVAANGAPVPHGPVEISIGTIHVSVDAPPAARTVAQPAAPQQRMAAAAPAPRSAFSRARLPRS